MDKLPSYYEHLQVAEDASAEMIRGAYRCLAQKWHPDKNPDRRAQAEGMIRLINKAYTVLSDPALRRAHDASLAERRTLHACSRAGPSLREGQRPRGNQPRQNQAQQPRRKRARRRTEAQVLPSVAWGVAAGLVAFALCLVAFAEQPSVRIEGHDYTLLFFVLVGGLVGACGRLASRSGSAGGSGRYVRRRSSRLIC